jgi:hypothetical protein
MYPLGWYSFKIYVNTLVSVDKLFGKGDLSLCKDIGLWSAERDLTSVFNLYTKSIFKSPSTLKTAPHVMWTNYFSQGDLVFVEIPDRVDIPEIKAIARIVDFPDAAKPNCRLLEGWIESIFQHVVEDAAKADQTFSMLMGEEVPPRKSFIQAHAKSVKNLDI